MPDAVSGSSQLKLGVLASGSGTILAAILESGLPVEMVVVDRKCRAVDLAAEAGVHCELVERASFGSDFARDEYTESVVSALRSKHIDVVAMAGFGTILGPAIFAVWPGRVLNTHPALLPAFKGWHAVREALEAGVEVTGTTVHIATEDVDAGPVLAQERVPVLSDDTEATLHERIKQVERTLYPETIRRFLQDLASGRPPFQPSNAHQGALP